MLAQTAHQLGVDRYNIRKPDRVRVLLTSRLRIPGQQDIEVSVKNISNRGFMGEVAEPLAEGTDAMVFLPGIGWTLASVRWTVGTRFGARFADSINMRQFWRANPPMRVTELEEVRLSA